MNLDHPNKNERQMKETLQQHEFPFDPSAWQNMKAKLADSSIESTPGAGQRSSDSDQPPGISFITTIILIMTTISVFSIALWFGLASPDTHTSGIAFENNLDKTINTEMAENATEKNELTLKENKATTTNATLEKNISGNKNEMTEKINSKKSNDSETPAKYSNNKINDFSENESLAKSTVLKSDQEINGAFNENVNEQGTGDVAAFLNVENQVEDNISGYSEILSADNIVPKITGSLSGKEGLVFLETLLLPFLETTDSNELNMPVAAPTDPISEKRSDMDIKFGVGHGFMGTGDNSMLVFKSEITKKWLRFFSASFSANYGVKYTGLSKSASIFHTDLNLFLSPFGNRGRNNFKIGTGASFLYVDDVWLSGSRFENGELIEEFTFDKRKTLGYNVIIEHEISLGEKYLMGFNANVQQYLSGDINSSLLVKFGVRL